LIFDQVRTGASRSVVQQIAPPDEEKAITVFSIEGVPYGTA
jgi:hypothetical protein